MRQETTTLYRPTGSNELDRVRQSGWREWPPRLPEQPIFYPVLNEAYARQIARDWNAKQSSVGYVTRFHVRADYLASLRSATGRYADARRVLDSR
jgi:hypothetical protein